MDTNHLTVYVFILKSCFLFCSEKSPASLIQSPMGFGKIMPGLFRAFTVSTQGQNLGPGPGFRLGLKPDYSSKLKHSDINLHLRGYFIDYLNENLSIVIIGQA